MDPGVRCKAFLLDEIHALGDKAVNALLIPLERDVVNLWIACTSRPAGSLDAALRSRFAYHLNLGAADVQSVLLDAGRDVADADRLSKLAQGDLRRALAGGTVARVVSFCPARAGFAVNCRWLREPGAVAVAGF